MSSLKRSPKTDIDVEKEHLNHNQTNSREKELQIVIRSQFNLPDGWLVEQHRRRNANPNHVDRIDRYFIEPNTGQRFRSWVSVQRYLNEETRDYLPTQRMISENKNTTCIKSKTKQKFRPVRDFEGASLTAGDFEGGGLTGENACRPTPKIVFKFGSGKRSAPTTQNSIQSHSGKTHSEKKTKSGKDERGSIHNSTRPPRKVSWVLSGPGGFWNPFLDDSIVPASEKEKWSKAFSISINEGVTN